MRVIENSLISENNKTSKAWAEVAGATLAGTTRVGTTRAGKLDRA